MPRNPRSDDIARAAAGEPPEPLGTESETVGTVKFWRDTKGYGAVSSEATAPWDIWCHFSAIEGTGYKDLVPGELVAVRYYRANQESYRYLALAVRRLAPELREPGPSPGAG
jgi:cold shock CspA family protein